MENNKKNKAILYAMAAVILVLVALFFLVKKKSVETTEVKGVKSGIKQAKLEIEDLVIEPERPTSTSIIRIIPVLNRAKARNMVFQYRWFVNGEEVRNLNKKILPQAFFKKDDRIYCQVKVTEGNQSAEEKRSRTFVVGNSPPRVQHNGIPKLNIPGTLVYQIHAYDPDNDPLEYNLISPLDQGIELDSKTGLLRWYIKKLPEKKKIIREKVSAEESSGEKSAVSSGPRYHEIEVDNPAYQEVLTIMFEVRDSSGDWVKVSLEINLKTGKEQTY